MPLVKGASKKAMKKNFEELGEGKTYAKTKAKFGKAKANKQRVAIVLNTARKAKKGK